MILDENPVQLDYVRILLKKTNCKVIKIKKQLYLLVFEFLLIIIPTIGRLSYTFIELTNSKVFLIVDSA